jgi:hypothetical protein
MLVPSLCLCQAFLQHFKAGSVRPASKELGEAVLWRCTCAKMVLVFYNGDLVPANFYTSLTPKLEISGER